MCIHLDGHQLFNVKKAVGILEQELQYWPLHPEQLIDFIGYVLLKARRVYESRSNASCNAIRIHFSVSIVHNYYVYNERLAMDQAIQQSKEEERSCMVPAAESATKCLKAGEVPAGSADMCTVCLEEMKGGCDAVAATPCSHVFHEDCIKQWFRTSHYCPVCRFEMPTD